MLFCFLSLLFHLTSFLFYFWLIGQFVPAVSLPDWGSHFEFFFSSEFVYIPMSSVVLISDLLYQSAAIVFLDGSRVSETLVMVSLAFHLFLVGTVIFASVLLCQVTKFFIPSKENVGVTRKEQRHCTHVKD